jgi:hypothetical protein
MMVGEEKMMLLLMRTGDGRKDKNVTVDDDMTIR